MDKLFNLRIKLTETLSTLITAYDGHGIGRERIDIEVTMEGEPNGPRTIFPKGSLYVGGPACGGFCLDGIAAKALVLSAVGMREGDTDRKYFWRYTSEQLEFSEQWGEEISMAGYNNYCDLDCNELEELDGPDPLEVDA
jgi:hypothetical protein